MSCSPVYKQIRTTNKNGWTPFQFVSCLLHSLWADQTNDENIWPSREWVALQSLSGSESLMRIAKHPLREWVILQSFEHIRLWTTDKNGWTPSREWVTLHSLSRSESLTRMAEHPSRMWVAPLFVDQNHLWEWLNTHLGSELLFSLWADQKHWWEWLNTHPDCESLFSLWTNQN